MRKKEITIPESCASIQEYEKTTYWKKKSAELLEDKSLICPICGRPHFIKKRDGTWKKRRFCVHHTTYRNVPNEEPEDLLILCTTCHSVCHKLLRYQNLGKMYKELAGVVRKYFSYNKDEINENKFFRKK